MAELNTLTLNMEVQNQNLRYNAHNRVVSGSIDYLYIKFSFSDDWRGTIYALFWMPDTEQQPIAVEVIDNGCYVPNIVIQPPHFRVSLYCMDGSRLITTEAETVQVYQSVYTAYAELAYPPDAITGATPVYTPTDDTKVSRIRATDIGMEYSLDGKTWKPIKEDITAVIGTF